MGYVCFLHFLEVLISPFQRVDCSVGETFNVNSLKEFTNLIIWKNYNVKVDNDMLFRQSVLPKSVVPRTNGCAMSTLCIRLPYNQTLSQGGRRVAMWTGDNGNPWWKSQIFLIGQRKNSA